MLQCLEWEPSGSFYRVRDSEIDKNGKEESPAGGAANTRVMHLEDITDPSLPPNPQKTILYRPSATHFLAVRDAVFWIASLDVSYVEFAFILFSCSFQCSSQCLQYCIET